MLTIETHIIDAITVQVVLDHGGDSIGLYNFTGSAAGKQAAVLVADTIRDKVEAMSPRA